MAKPTTLLINTFFKIHTNISVLLQLKSDYWTIKQYKERRLVGKVTHTDDYCICT